MRSKFLIVIVTFNPDLDFLINNLNSFQGYEVLVIDNNSQNSERIKLIQQDYSNVSFILNQDNLGIAEALNQGLRYATNLYYDYILTLDQDSSFATDITSLVEGFLIDSNVAIVSPSIFDVNSKHEEISNRKYEEVFIAITSGCLCSVKKLNEVGGFNSKLFIDYVDYEICLKLHKEGYKIIRTNKVLLNHSLGESKIYNLLGVKFISTNHNPLRRYYNARNRVYIYKKYFLSYPKFVIHNVFSFLKTILIVVIFEDRKVSKLSNIFKGIVEGVVL